MNKALVTVSVPSLEEEYDIYIPVFKNIGVAIELITKTVNELSEGHLPLKNDYILMTENGEILKNENIVKNSNIKNGTKIFLL